MGIINNSKTDPNKILPMQYKWAWKHYIDGVNNNWNPSETPMQDDIELWKSDRLTKDERKMILWNLGFFSTAESLTANNIILAIYNHVTNPEARCYLLRQAFEEAIHTHTFVYCCDSLALNPNEIYNMYKSVPSIKAKDDFVIKLTESVFDPNFKLDSPQSIQKFLHDLIGYYIIMEGIFFYAGFSMMLALGKQNKMTGVTKQFEYILRDESVHLSFGNNLIRTIKEENYFVWTSDFQKNIVSLIKDAVKLEKQYALDACPNGLFGIHANQFCEYIEYIADKRLSVLGLNKVYNTENPFPWLSEMTDLSKETNFFEGTVTEYQSGGLEW